jgi:hypothetical protein
MTRSVELGSSRLEPDRLEFCDSWLQAWHVYRRDGVRLGYMSARRDGTHVTVGSAALIDGVIVSSIGVGVQLLQAVTP